MPTVSSSSSPILFLNLIFITLSSTTIAVTDQRFLYYTCPNPNSTAYTAYKTNLNNVASSLISDTSNFKYGFFNFSAGKNPNRVYAIGLCRGDVEPNVCRKCLNVSRFQLPKRCLNLKEAIQWYNECMVRYSNRSILGIMEEKPVIVIRNTNAVSLVENFNKTLSELLGNLSKAASEGSSLLKYAAGSAAHGSKRIYGLVQCTPDLTELECSDCLSEAIGQIQFGFYSREGARVLMPSCNLRYAIQQFFEDVSDAPSPLLAPQPESRLQSNNTQTTAGKESEGSKTVIIVAVLVVVVALLIIFICIFIRVRKQRDKAQKTISGVEDLDKISKVDSLQYDFDAIKAGTDNFSNANKLGQGGFGLVYKGKLPNGQFVAVKRLSQSSAQGHKEFSNEVQLMAKLSHRNLVRLLGFCLEGEERVLIYEFMPNGSLDHFIFDKMEPPHLGWELRYKIIKGIARGLLYLHEDSQLRIVHRDLKASNILLATDMNAKICDFGIARLFELDETNGKTSRVVGTFGYMAPEYALHGNFSVKSDVFSFGVLVLEIISGQRNTRFNNGDNSGNLLSYVWRSWGEGPALNLVDRSLKTTGSCTEMKRCIHIGLLCVQDNLADRPTMASVILMLNSHSISLPAPSRPGFYINNQRYAGHDLQISESNSQLIECSGSESLITELYPR